MNFFYAVSYTGIVLPFAGEGKERVHGQEPTLGLEVVVHEIRTMLMSGLESGSGVSHAAGHIQGLGWDVMPALACCRETCRMDQNWRSDVETAWENLKDQMSALHSGKSGGHS